MWKSCVHRAIWRHRIIKERKKKKTCTVFSLDVKKKLIFLVSLSLPLPLTIKLQCNFSKLVFIAILFFFNEFHIVCVRSLYVTYVCKQPNIYIQIWINWNDERENTWTWTWMHQIFQFLKCWCVTEKKKLRNIITFSLWPSSIDWSK